MPTANEQVTQPAKRKGRPKGSESRVLHQNIVKMHQSVAGISNREISRELGIHQNTVADTLAKYGINKQELDTFVENRNSIVKSKQQMILDAITPDKMIKAGVKDLTVAYGIMLDKDRLESGESTSNIASWTAIVTAAHSKEADITPKGNCV
jgi:transposase